MSSLHTFQTYIRMSLGGIDEHEVEAHVSYWFTPAWPQSHDDPGSDASVEIDNIQIKHGKEYHGLPPWLTDVFAEDETLQAECMADYVDYNEAAREQAAEHRYEMIREERFERKPGA
jgi:hypothetical protein